MPAARDVPSQNNELSTVDSKNTLLPGKIYLFVGEQAKSSFVNLMQCS